jgi:tripartite-type tricarboxylate transporter receptor subunit TctC
MQARGILRRGETARRVRAGVALSSVAALALTLSACQGENSASAGEDYPADTVRFIVPYSAGGPTDLGARALTACLGEEIGGNWVVENIDGGAGAPAMLEVAGAEPDGYTLGVGSQSTFVTTPIVAGGAGYTFEDFTYAGQMMEFPALVLVAPDSPYDTIEELLDAARENPNSISLGTSGAQVSFTLAARQLAEHGVKFNVVPFDGTSDADAAFLGGKIDVRWEAAAPGTLELIESGKMKPLATGADARLPYFPDVPTLEEVGVADLVSTRTFYGVVGPKDLPADVTSKLTAATETCVTANEEYRKTIGEKYATYLTSEELIADLESYDATVSEILG